MSIEDLLNKYYHPSSTTRGTDSSGSSGASKNSNRSNYDAYETYGIFHKETKAESNLLDKETFEKIQNGEIETDDELALSIINAAQSDDDKERISYKELEELCDYFAEEVTDKIEKTIDIDDEYRNEINQITEYYIGKNIDNCSEEELNKAITNRLIDTIAKKTEAFKENAGYQLIKGDGNTNMSYSVVTPNNLDPNKEAPVIVYLHGAGGSERSLYSQIFNNYNLDKGFNGYIICPTLNRGNWDNENVAKDIDEILNSFSQNHNIDPNNIVIAGHSLGGTGALYMADSETFKDDVGFKFQRSAVLTGYPQKPKDGKYDIPIGLWVDSGSKYLLNNNVLPSLNLYGEDKYVDWVGKSHGQIDNLAFTEDLDADGKADLIEWLFNED